MAKEIDLSILIPARNEDFLAKTVENLLENIRGNTEILVGLDGQWDNPKVPEDDRVTILYHSESIGQRAMTNDLARLAKGKYLMKLDAHCSIDEGMDVKMVEAMTGHDDWTMIPALYNLHAFNWKCKKCGNEWYQSPTPTECQLPGEAAGKNTKCDGKDFEKVVYWQKRDSRRSEAYRFDSTLHFQYHRDQMKQAKGEIIETMSAQGSCFMLTREKYWELNICDEEFGSWGQQGTEVACKTWLSGGRLVTNRKTWYAHMFRTQGGDFGFPFPLSGEQVEHAREYSKELFLENTWKGQIYPLIWLIDKFKPLPDWHRQGEEMYDKVVKAGEEFYKTHARI
jgi:glycosyltransferase involved in cell wall biosynthesis